MELLGHVKNYDWGKIGFKSVVAQLAALNDQDFCLIPDSPYAELWMGDHVSGPALNKQNGLEMGQFLDNKLSFLLKVLSIRKALSIQVHPNKEQAEILHRERPDIYKDPNHKPELAIALTPFVALCGFRPYKEIYEICTKIRPLKKIIGEKNLQLLADKPGPESLKTVFREVTYTPMKLVKLCLYEINKEYRPELNEYGICDIFKTLMCQFPDDIGILSLFFLNVVHLAPGQSIYLGANIIHAYLQGDCIECMACSDNVIRAGLTPKYRDVKQLLASLNYEGASVDANIFQPIYFDEYKTIYAPPVEDFAVVRIKLPLSVEEYSTEYKPVDSILIVVHGAGYMKFPSQCITIPLKRGNIYYIPPCAAPELVFEPVECETCEDVPPVYDIDAEIGIFSVEVHTDSSQKSPPLSMDTFPTRTPSYEGFVDTTSSDCAPDIEKFSSGFLKVEEVEEEHSATSSTEDIPLSKRRYQDFEVYIASANIFMDFAPPPGDCCPAMKKEKPSNV